MYEVKGNNVIPFAIIGSQSGVLFNGGNAPSYEFHISREVRQKYKFEETLFSFNGNVIFANFHASRVFTKKLNEKRSPEDMVRVGQVNAMGLLDEIYHYILRQYEARVNPEVFTRAVGYLKKSLGEEEFNKTLTRFVETFPPVNVQNGQLRAADYLSLSTDGKPNNEIVIEELLLLYFANFNPANSLFKELFDDIGLKTKTSYKGLIISLDKFFKNEKPYGPDNQYIFDLLRTPILNNPDSLEEQLKYVLNRWNLIIDKKYKDKLLSGMDLIKEDKRMFFGGGGGAPSVVPKYKSGFDDNDFLTLGKSGYRYGRDSYKDYLETEKFTTDIHWMPQVVLLAKNVYVWLDQLSQKYNRAITKLDQIPDEELDILAQSNFTGLWLIGLWERSRASQKIKQFAGNFEAVPSAYSIYDYVVSYELGGEESFQNLKYRCMQRGIRLASDMVPNHMGIYSKWIIDHPDYFIQSAHSPFPNYSFTGADLSDDPNIQLRIEDGYWSKTDAAVVFQRTDNRSGEVRFIYHGNDGTNMPWNDTAQLDMLKDYVREAVIQTIFHVAKKTSIIRFDAAMTLAKKHFHRLWYPQPGAGGDIPSRSDHGLRQEDFDSFFPKEFWREVVDRINHEMPDTLLLAEAFWLMEGYFVRTLGMHRVYNSSFMHMIMKEENEKYRDLISNTLEFNPEILKRYVNFMSNPDEETAIRQFGTDDKYFGVAILMVTLPGLPMFAHGQVEGYSEKYGMEYKRAYYSEHPNEYLVERHKREIFPLMSKRYMFSQVTDFWFYDFIDSNGYINENVFAYTNKSGNERSIVIYNNKYDEARGWINKTTAKAVPTGHGEEKTIAYSNLAQALDLKTQDNYFYIYRDHQSNLEYIRTGEQLSNDGLYVELKGFNYHVFLDFMEVFDQSGEYFNLMDHLNGSGTQNIEGLRIELRLVPVHESFMRLFDNELLEDMSELYVINTEAEQINEAVNFMLNKYRSIINEIKLRLNHVADINPIINEFKKGLTVLKDLNEILTDDDFILENEIVTRSFRKAIMINSQSDYPRSLLIYLIWQTLNNLKMIRPESDSGIQSLMIADELLLFNPIAKILKRLGRGDKDAEQIAGLIRILLRFNPLYFHLPKESVVKKEEQPVMFQNRVLNHKLTQREGIFIEQLISDSDARQYIGVNYFQGEWYYSKESFEELSDWIFTIRLVSYLSNKPLQSVEKQEFQDYVWSAFHLNIFIRDISSHSEYKLTNLYDNIFLKKENLPDAKIPGE
ncbi:MAG: alpha-amylase family glycosyl hydrolase [Ignavibacteria bacterium]